MIRIFMMIKKSTQLRVFFMHTPAMRFIGTKKDVCYNKKNKANANIVSLYIKKGKPMHTPPLLFFDSHCHLADEAFDNDRAHLISACIQSGMAGAMVPGYDLPSSQKAISLCESYLFLWCSAGMHPHDAKDYNAEFAQALNTMLRHPKVKAVGEIGLDYHYDNTPRPIQKDVFAAQLSLAKALGKPVIIHSRDAAGDTYDILKSFSGEIKGVMHSCTQSPEMVKKLLDLGLYISISGVVTFKNAVHVREMAAQIPLDRLLVETDSPYLSPHPRRGEKNTPQNIPYILETLSTLTNTETALLAQITCANAIELFSLEDSLCTSHCSAQANSNTPT